MLIPFYVLLKLQLIKEYGVDQDRLCNNYAICLGGKEENRRIMKLGERSEISESPWRQIIVQYLGSI